ncbi:low temperature requirement protein A [Rugosimonospora acidiphila]|uniref:Low temperature requirement protein A n=1 Tax=Rugosimonospora acidiphila TaxID=556531 RepID=A0ABP9RQ67_9ACTN
MGESVAARGEEEIRQPGRLNRPGFVELYFDLVYVVALVVLGQRLVGHLTWLGVGQTLILFLAFAVIWMLTAWVPDTFNADRARIQVQIIWVMIGILVMCRAVSGAFEGRGPLFAIAYLSVHLGASTYLRLSATGADVRSRMSRILFWFCVSGPLWLVGAFTAADHRTALWGGAILLEYTAAALGWPAPKLGRSAVREWRLEAERVSERYRQLLIVAFGVVIFVSGLMLSRGSHTLDRFGAFVVMFATTALMWRTYTHRAGTLLSQAFAASFNASRFGQFAGIAHLIMVAGVLAEAVTAQLLIAHPVGGTSAPRGAVILGGPVLFLIGRGLLDYLVFSRVSWSRPGALILLAALAPAVELLPPIAVGGLAAVILLGVAIVNVAAIRRHPPMAAPPTVR